MYRGVSAESPKAERSFAIALLRFIEASIKIDERLVVPEILTQFLSRDDVAVILEEAGKNAKRLVLQLDANTMLAKLSGSQIYLKHAES